MIDIVLADDAHLVRGAIVALLELEEDLRVVAETGRGDEVERVVMDHRPDVVVLDIDMPGANGLDVAEALSKSAPSCGLVVLTSFGRPGYLRKALNSGVRGFLHKDSPVEQLSEAIRRVHEGGRSIDPELATFAMTAGLSPLTGRETDVLKVAAGGSQVSEIAAELRITEGTVRNYLSSVMAKTGAKSRIGAIRVAQEMGWL